MKKYCFNNEIFESLTDAQDAAYFTALDLYQGVVADDPFGRDVLEEDPRCSRSPSNDEVERQETMLNEFIDLMFSEIVEFDANEAANLVA